MAESVTDSCPPPPLDDTELVVALAAGMSCADAAARAGVNKRTIVRWRQDAVFAQAVRDARAELLQETCGALSAASADMVAVLKGIAENKQAADGVRVQAAKAVLENNLGYRKLLDLEAELRDLRARVEATAAAQGQQLPGGGG